ncbi:DinB family protein [Chengkuizengella axinellae]|uniref:DinB family protein n=1 Tax=Chengkuizengella axinellae TaxID=3064388 RepID=A0ABT9IW53_9BACL|nr:DinB family protein [Chengkuizengella sp. 2205SS18-9]MDP5273595.1 DinB family protein [Chengkuizengella sp. 2205SS18-9]
MKKDLLNELLQINSWALNLRKLDQETIYQPLAEHKWSIAEILSHLMLWDRYILHERIPLMVPNASLKSDVNVSEMNSKASEYTRSKVSFEEIINNLVDSRERIVSILEHKTEDELSSTFKINNNELNLISYFKGTVQHDEHHMQQINDFLKS